jgi:hypothetical protein
MKRVLLYWMQNRNLVRGVVVSMGVVAFALAPAAAPPLASPGHPGWTSTGGRCFVWNRDPKPNETVECRGGCKHSRASGKGSEIWQSDKKQAGRYDAKMRDGKKNGHGVNTWANGDRSDGKYRDDKENGHGV